MKKVITIIIVSFFFFLLFFIPLSLFLFSKTHTPLIHPLPSPTSQPTQSAIIMSPSLPPTIQVDPQTRLMEKIQNRQALSQEDLAAKNDIVLLLPQGQKSGVVYQSPDFIIEYIQSADLFQVEMLTTHTAQAKSEATQWFLSKQVSQQGICNLPVAFYLNSSIKSQIPNANSFNPLPDGC